MSRFPSIRAAELVKFLKARGFVEDRQRGSHLILWHPTARKAVSVPIHTGRDLGRGLALRILREVGLTAEDFLNWR
ncbi:MAG: type II toxin-antitoxin system HicA family toxin [Verrucomicrobia bacterium]|nr:type II toxin-antitoxin system HicA family toxin [Verrucomicrobiota bacterium]